MHDPHFHHNAEDVNSFDGSRLSVDVNFVSILFYSIPRNFALLLRFTVHIM